jgi:Ca-activated chloride channel family protein
MSLKFKVQSLKLNYVRRFTFYIFLFSLFSLFSIAQNPVEQPKQLTRILFLFDDSQSMIARWQSDTKFEIAKKLLSEMVDSLKHVGNLELALRVYGHTKNFPPQDCDDTRLEVPFASGNSYEIKKKLKEIHPSGTTPIAASLQECGKDFPEDPSRNIIILITDGIEECNGDPCAVSYQLQKKGVVLKPFIIGLGMSKDFAKTFECVGNYYDAAEESSFRTILNVVISQALNNTTMQVNLLDAYGKPTETNVGMTFYDNFSGAISYNFIHTMNAKGYPDTLKVDPLSTYKIVVHTLPPVSKDSVKVTPGKHTIVGIVAPQGDLLLKLDGSSEYKNLQAIVRKNKEMNTLHVQSFNTKERYIIGTYDLEILTLPEMFVKDVEISQSKTTIVEIPKPGIVTLLNNNTGYGSIYVEENNKLKWIYSMDENFTKESVVLQPGKYRVIFRPKSSRESIYTIDKIFRVASGSSISVTVY